MDDRRWDAEQELLYDLGRRYCADCSDTIYEDDELMVLDGDDLCVVCFDIRKEDHGQAGS